ncbi:unnamed protein product, partial [Rotaria sordida]
MNLGNIVEHLLDLTKAAFGFEAKTTTTSDEIFVSQQLFEILKAFKHSCFNELHTYDSLEFDDEYDDMMDEESSDGSDDFEETQDPDLKDHFTLEEMKSIVEWVDQHPNHTIATTSYARNWFESKRSLISIFTPHEILNNDHCLFQQEYVSPRILSFTGERTTEVAVKTKHNITYSYTVQPISSAA